MSGEGNGTMKAELYDGLDSKDAEEVERNKARMKILKDEYAKIKGKAKMDPEVRDVAFAAVLPAPHMLGYPPPEPPPKGWTKNGKRIGRIPKAGPRTLAEAAAAGVPRPEINPGPIPERTSMGPRLQVLAAKLAGLDKLFDDATSGERDFIISFLKERFGIS